MGFLDFLSSIADEIEKKETISFDCVYMSKSEWVNGDMVSREVIDKEIHFENTLIEDNNSHNSRAICRRFIEHLRTVHPMLRNITESDVDIKDGDDELCVYKVEKGKSRETMICCYFTMKRDGKKMTENEVRRFWRVFKVYDTPAPDGTNFNPFGRAYTNVTIEEVPKHIPQIFGDDDEW